MVPVALLVSLAVCVAWAAHKIRTYYALRSFGGHWSVGWSRLWQFQTQRSGEMHVRFTTTNRRYGSTARIAPGMLITSDPDLIRRMNAVRSDFTRGPWYTSLKLHPDLDNIVSYVDEGIHSDLRTRMAPGYSGKENLHMEQDVDDKVLTLIGLIDDKYVADPENGVHKTVDLSRITNFFTLDVISKIAFGETFGFLDKDDDPFGYLENLEQFLPAIIVFSIFTELTNIMKIPFIKPLLPSSTDKRGLGRVMGFARDRVQERFSQPGGVNKPVKRQDMLGSFIKRGLSQPQLESESLIQITAGSDSTASALRLTLHFMSTNPLALNRLLGELEAAIDAGKISRPVIKDSEARRLPYLQACIKEGLRIYPPVTGLMAKMVPPGGTYINVDGEDKFAPTGTQIGQNSWGMMHNPAIFGPDAEIFRPERWLPKDGSQQEKERLERMMETVGLCFGAGRFGCLGRGVAMMELNKALPELLLRYTLQPCSLAKPFTEMVVGFYIHRDMYFVLTKRDKTNSSGNSADGPAFSTQNIEADALPGAQEE